MIDQHVTWVTRHDIKRCNTARHAEGGICGTYYEAHCSCGFVQGAICHEHAIAIGRGHRATPTAQCIEWKPPPINADTITERDLCDLFERHCECRPLDLERSAHDHAAIHDCDTGILADVQIARDINLFNDARHQARDRCAEIINAARKNR